jgi:hypothetical protein
MIPRRSATTPFSVVDSAVLDGGMVALAVRLGGYDPGRGWGLLLSARQGGWGVLSGLGGDHQCVVALNLQLAAVEQPVVAQVGIEANVPARLRVLAVAVIASLPCTLEVFYRHAGPGASSFGTSIMQKMPGY